jgi:ParB family chromosome partitioning protein
MVETNSCKNHSVTDEIPIDCIIPDSNQPRKHFDEEGLKELAESIRQHGLLQPILVRPFGNGKFQIVHGERRFRACKLLGFKTIRVEVKELTDNQVLEIQLVENLQREDLNPIEEAETFRRMVEELGYTHEDIAKKIGKSREYVTNKLRLLKLPENIKRALLEGKISEGHARALLPLEESRQKQVFDEILAKELNVRQTEEIVKGNIVSRETFDVPKDGVIIGVWVSNESYNSLLKLANSKGTTVEKLCSQIIEEAVRNCQ